MKHTLQTQLFWSEPQTYDGTPLSPHWIFQKYDLLGDALIAFHGPAQVGLHHMVDLEDVKKTAPIFSPKMLHFLGEWFHDPLELAILYQHYLAGLVYAALLERQISKVWRRGNDIYVGEGKLTVSIATKSLVSTLIHLGINIETEGTPVKTCGLRELDIAPEAFARQILDRFAEDYAGWQKARVKVSPR